jgi:hypothetical protein
MRAGRTRDTAVLTLSMTRVGYRSRGDKRQLRPILVPQRGMKSSHVTAVSGGSGTRTKPNSFARRVMFCTTRSLY